MRFRIKNRRDVLLGAALITLLAVSVPLLVVGIAVWNMPAFIRVPSLVVAGMIPLLITVPLAILSLNMLRLINSTVERLDVTTETLDGLLKFDHLTGVLTRGYFLSSLEQVRTGKGHFIMLDADHFKRINDSHGHEAGDAVLKLIGRTAVQLTGANGLVGRLGGEEFGIYLPASAPEQAELFASGLGSAIRNQRIPQGGQQIGCTISMGIARDAAGLSVPELMRCADARLYEAKRAGRDRHVMAGDSAGRATVSA